MYPLSALLVETIARPVLMFLKAAHTHSYHCGVNLHDHPQEANHPLHVESQVCCWLENHKNMLLRLYCYCLFVREWVISADVFFLLILFTRWQWCSSFEYFIPYQPRVRVVPPRPMNAFGKSIPRVLPDVLTRAKHSALA